MSALDPVNPFAKPKVPSLQAAPSAPSRATSATQVREAQSRDRLRRRNQRGRAATFLTRGAIGDDTVSGGLATKTLLGQ